MRGNNDMAQLFFTQGTVVAKEPEALVGSDAKKKKQPAGMVKFCLEPKYGRKILFSVPPSFAISAGQKADIIDFQFKNFEKHQMAVYNHTDKGCFFFGTVHDRVLKTKTIKPSHFPTIAASVIFLTTLACSFLGFPYPTHVDEGFGITYWTITLVPIYWPWAIFLPFFTFVVLNTFSFRKKKKVDLAIRDYVVSSIREKYKEPVEYQTYFERGVATAD